MRLLRRVLIQWVPHMISGSGGSGGQAAKERFILISIVLIVVAVPSSVAMTRFDIGMVTRE